MFSSITIVGVALLGAIFPISSVAYAGVIYSENFDQLGFQGSPIGGTHSSDHWSSLDDYRINDYDGWTFTGSAALFIDNDSQARDGALSLNECCIGSGGGAIATTTINGLTVGQSYRLSILEWGDNEPGGTYTLDTQIGNDAVRSYNGTDGSAGTNPGTLLTYTFVASSGSETLTLSEANSVGGASPVVDDIIVAGVPEPSAWTLTLIGVAGLGAALRSTRRRAAIAIG